MPVFIYEPDAFRKLCKVEGKDYPRNQKNFGICGFAAFKKKWKRIVKAYPEIIEQEKEYAMNVEGNRAI